MPTALPAPLPSLARAPRLPAAILLRSGLPLIVALLAPVAGCSAGSTAGSAAAPAPARLTARGPVGLYFMSRYISGGSLELAAWYFSADGQVYRNLAEGFSPELLASHTGPKGSYSYDGAAMEIEWSGGRKTKSEVEKDKDPDTFMWDMGIFTPVRPLGDAKALAGTYEGGLSASHGGSTAANARTLELREDGTYSLSSVGSVQAVSAAGEAGAGSSGGSRGKWIASGYTLTLTADDGAVTRRIAFPYDDGSTPGRPNRLYFGGTMLKRR